MVPTLAYAGLVWMRFCHPGEPLLGAAKVVVVEEAGGLVVLAGEGVLLLAARRAVEVDDDVDAQVGGFLDHGVEVREHAGAVGKGLAGLVDNVRVRPVPDGDADGVEADVVNRLHGIRVDPISPVLLELLIASLSVAALVVVVHAVEFRGRAAAAEDVPPFVLHHPGLADEPAPKVDAADLGHAIGQRGLEAFAELLKPSRLVEGLQVTVLREPRRDGARQTYRPKNREMHRD